MNAWEFVQGLGFGWNLGDTLDSRVGRDERADLTPAKQETAWHNPLTTPEMIKTVADAGFTLLRVPVSWADFIADAPEYTIAPAFLARVEEVVCYGFDNKMNVILNLHHEDWHFPSYENYPAASEKLIAVWTQIANHFEKYPTGDSPGDDGNTPPALIFEVMNEPRKVGTPVEWNGGDDEGREVVAKMGLDCIRAIRATGGNNAKRFLMVPTHAGSFEEEALKALKTGGDANVIASVHAYTPFVFALSNENPVHEWTPEFESHVDDLFARLDKILLSKGIPVIMGEMGARRRGDNLKDRVEWAKYFTSVARKYGVPCVWWDNGRIEGPERWEKFGLLDRRKCEWVYPELLEAFL